jgi:hypothetical protein
LAERPSAVSTAHVLAALVPQAEALEKRCAAVWDASVHAQRRFRELRKVDPLQAARHREQAGRSEAEDSTLTSDVDVFFDAVTQLYLAADPDGRNQIRERRRAIFACWGI